MTSELKIFNTFSGSKETFHTDSSRIGVYVCGITPYDTTHIGHAFTYVFFDVVVRYLRNLGHRVVYVQNLTDIDDDILRKADQMGENWRELAERNTQRFLDDMRWLGNLPPDIYPRATDHIQDIVTMIQGLVEKGVAYVRNGGVYFPVDLLEEFGKLSKLRKEEMLPIADERGNDSRDPNKRNPLDFVLWQPRKPGEPSWPSPWGDGRPGWHIECSCMSIKYLGQTVDIHGGGADLMFPHHDSSIAQSESLTGKPFVRYWMHTAMVRYQGEKMSKSLGNMVFIDDLRKKYSPNAVRICLLSHHYRFEWTFDDGEIERAQHWAEQFKAIWRIQSGMGEPLDISRYEEAFFQAMNDDFNTPEALEHMQALATRILGLNGRKNISDAKAFLNRAFNLLGLTLEYQ